MRRIVTCGLLALTALTLASAAQAQKVDRPWSVDFGTGWDRSISGNINSSAIGTLNGLSVVILPNKYEDVYGTGLYLRFGGGYLIDDRSQLRVSFTFQSLDADLTRMGDLGASNLYGQYADYQSFGIDFGYRRYFPFKRSVRGYAEGSIGVSIIDETDVVLAAPAINFTTTATDFYDKTAAFSLGGNAGVAFGVTPRVDLFAQLGLRFVTGMSEVDNLIGTGLDTINDHSSRWSLPFAFGVNYRF
jgi:opacity protein-like surface antigen